MMKIRYSLLFFASFAWFMYGALIDDSEGGTHKHKGNKRMRLMKFLFHFSISQKWETRAVFCARRHMKYSLLILAEALHQVGQVGKPSDEIEHSQEFLSNSSKVYIQQCEMRSGLNHSQSQHKYLQQQKSERK